MACPLIGPFCGGGKAPPIGGKAPSSRRLLPGSTRAEKIAEG